MSLPLELQPDTAVASVPGWVALGAARTRWNRLWALIRRMIVGGGAESADLVLVSAVPLVVPVLPAAATLLRKIEPWLDRHRQISAVDLRWEGLATESELDERIWLVGLRPEPVDLGDSL